MLGRHLVQTSTGQDGGQKTHRADVEKREELLIYLLQTAHRLFGQTECDPQRK